MLGYKECSQMKQCLTLTFAEYGRSIATKINYEKKNMIEVLRLFDMTERGLVHIPEYKNKKSEGGFSSS